VTANEWLRTTEDGKLAFAAMKTLHSHFQTTGRTVDRAEAEGILDRKHFVAYSGMLRRLSAEATVTNDDASSCLESGRSVHRDHD
jgi:hypothetical protein